VHPKHRTDKQNSSQLRYVTLASLPFTYLLPNETLLTALPLFTVQLHNYTFFFKNVIMDQG